MMNNRKRFGIIILLCTVIASAAFYTGTASAADLVKVGYVDLRVALNDSDSGKKAKVELESTIKTIQSSVDEKRRSIEKMQAEFEKQSSVLSAEAKKTKEVEIEKAVREYQRFVQDSQNEMKKKESDATVSILKELREVIDKIGREDGYSLILENVEGIILYSKKDLDITDRVIKNYNDFKSKKK